MLSVHNVSLSSTDNPVQKAFPTNGIIGTNDDDNEVFTYNVPPFLAAYTLSKESAAIAAFKLFDDDTVDQGPPTAYL